MQNDIFAGIWFGESPFLVKLTNLNCDVIKQTESELANIDM